MLTPERWVQRASRRRVHYQHRGRRIIDRARRRDLTVLLQRLPPIPPGTKVVIYDMPDPSWLSIMIAAVEDGWVNKWRRYDPYEVVIFSGIGLLGLILGAALAHLP